MNRRLAGTKGDNLGVSGLPPWPIYAVIAGFLFIVIIVNISSRLIENPSLSTWEPMLWELSSYLAILLLVPLIYFGYRQFHWKHHSLPRFLAIQSAFFIAFTLAHIALMVAMRTLGYGLAHKSYDFAHGRLILELIYEARKDAVTFIVIMGVVWVFERLRTIDAPAKPLAPKRIEIKTDGRTLYLDPLDICYIEAAGNYVELYQTTKPQPLLLRGTLNEFEARLKPYDFVRAHRSRLINRHHIASHTGTPSGDLRIVLLDARELVGSRRYRDNFTTKTKP